MTSKPTPPSTDPEHEAVTALLTSDDWQRRLETARAQRTRVLEQRARDGTTSPPPESRMDAARRQRFEGAGDAPQDPPPVTESLPKPEETRLPTRRILVAAAAAILVLLAALGLWRG